MSSWGNIELFPLYQRIVNLTNPQIDYGFEATIRGKPPFGEHLLPSELFGQAQDDQERILLDFKARSIAIRDGVELVKKSLLFLNCSCLSLQKGFVFGNIDELAIPVKQLVLEISEQTPLDNVEFIKQELGMLRNQGMKIALDDFGTGFSNFWLVEAFQPDYIKLDRSIIAHVDQTEQARRVVKGMVEFASKVNSILIAEGIERKAQKEILVHLGVVYGQGFFLGRPFSLQQSKEIQRIGEGR